MIESKTFIAIKKLIEKKDVLISSHGYDELAEDNILVWGIPKDKKNPAVLITAYRPDPEKWSDDFKRRL